MAQPARREVLLGGLLTIVWHQAAGTCAFAQTRRLPCLSSARDLGIYASSRSTIRSLRTITGNERFLPTGDPVFERALAQTLLMLTRMFKVVPGFGFVQEPRGTDNNEQMNAVAMPLSRDGGRYPHGTVLFGLNLLRAQRAERDSPEVRVAGICAHEWAHILQYERGLVKLEQGGGRLDGRTHKPCELHADFMAGYFAGVRRLERPTFPYNAIAMTMHSLGSSVPTPNAVDDHGTKEERRAAVIAGFQVAHRDRKSFDEAVEIGVRMFAG